MVCRSLSGQQAPGGRWRESQLRGDRGPKRGTRRGKRRWLRSPPSSAQNMQQEGKKRAATDTWDAGSRTTLCGRRTAKTMTRGKRESPRPVNAKDYLETEQKLVHTILGLKGSPSCYVQSSVYTEATGTSRIQPCLSLLTLMTPLAMENKSQLSHSASVPSGPLDAGSRTPFPQPVYYSDSHHLSGFCINIDFQSFWPTSLSAMEQTLVRRQEGLRCDGDWREVPGCSEPMVANGKEIVREFETNIYTLLYCK